MRMSIEEDVMIGVSQHSESIDNNTSLQRRVEIATLTLPAAANKDGVRLGEGTTFMLEASSRVIEQFVGNGASQASCIQEDNLESENLQQPFLKGVIDLDMISDLVNGVTDEEFMDILNQDSVRNHLESIGSDHTVNEIDITGGGTSQNSSCGEQQPLLNQCNHTACICLSADNFLQSVVDFRQKKKSLERINKGNESFFASNETTDSSVSLENGNDRIIPNTKEAFLLSIPKFETGAITEREIVGSFQDAKTYNKSADNVLVLVLPKNDASSKVDQRRLSMNGTRASLSKITAGTVVDTLQHKLGQVLAPLPTDVKHIELCVCRKKEEPEIHLDVVVKRIVPAKGYFFLVSGLLAISSVGVAFDLQQGGVTPEMKAFWRFSATAILFFFLAAKSLNGKEFAKLTWIELWVWVPFAGLNYGFMVTAFVIALGMTTLINTFILSNMAALIIIGAKFVMGVPILFFEGLGAIIGFAGALICVAATASANNGNIAIDNQNSSGMEMAGNVIAFLASISVALYLTVAKSLRAKIDLFVFMFLIFAYSSIALLIYIAYVGQKYELSMDPVVGIFGWMNFQKDRLPLELWMAIICNGFGTTGFIAIMKYFDPIVISMVMLLEPVIATFMGAAFGVSAMPGWITWVGDAVVVIGSILVIWSGSRKEEVIDATKVLNSEDDAQVPKREMKQPYLA